MADTDVSPTHHGAGDKANKYDRQLRLWGDHGQSALEGAKICLINATATGTEILKNVILPGIGSFTIVDGHKVSGEDVGNNFFLDMGSIGKSRAQVATELLQELNEDVNGDFVEESADTLLTHNPAFFNGFSIVVATSLGERTLLKLASQLYANDIPLLVCRSYGLLGYMRLVVREHTVIESHPDSAIDDLRLDRPFPGLSAYCDSLDLTAMSNKDHSHVPWLIIIYKHLTEWKKQHAGQGPKNYREKCDLKKCIRSGIRKNAEGVPRDEENFEEAMTHVNTALVPASVPQTVKDLFTDDSCEHLHSESKPFWILVRALREFVKYEGEGCLPLRGSIPDMTADSERYIRLQNVYKERASADVATLAGYVMSILQSLGRDEPLNQESRSPGSSPQKLQDTITDADIRMFCKNASFLRVLRCRSLAQEYDPSTAKCTELAMHLEDSDEDDLVHYVMLRAVDRFHAEFNRYPGYEMHAMEADIPNLKSCLLKLLQELGISQNIKDEFVHEFCRYGAAELHSVAAYMGGAAAQEVIKMVTGQFVPINNTYIYNAMKQTSTTLEL